MKYIQTYEQKGRPKTKCVKCIRDYSYVLNDDHVNPQLIPNDKKVYKFFEKGKMYKMNGPPDYPKFIYEQFIFERKNKGRDSDRRFEDYFEMPEETKKLIEWWYIKKDAEKYNL